MVRGNYEGMAVAVGGTKSYHQQTQSPPITGPRLSQYGLIILHGSQCLKLDGLLSIFLSVIHWQWVGSKLVPWSISFFEKIS